MLLKCYIITEFLILWRIRLIMSMVNLPPFNPAGCDYIGSGKTYSYAIYSSVSLTHQNAITRCRMKHPNGELVKQLSGNEDFDKIVSVLLYVGYINLNIEFWVGDDNRLKVGDENYTSRDGSLAPIIRLVAHLNATSPTVIEMKDKTEQHGFICSFPNSLKSICPKGFKPVR
ncbi:unnamed protein product [Heterobilharzia americana]|nr:unnamed protein product [Heterobilharzia americana]CAH8469911.1 unnamed protein product [Heterobilharzia americana]